MASWTSRVTLTHELPSRQYGSTVWFLGTYEDAAVVVEVYDVPDILRIRKDIAARGAATFDTPTYRMDLAKPKDSAVAEDRPATASVSRRGEPLTWPAFAALRTEAHRQRIIGQVGSSSWGPGYVAPSFLEPMQPVTAPAGSWYLPRPTSFVATRWHLFTGDLGWSPGWTDLAATAECGWVGGLASGALWADQPGESGPCRRCLATVAKRAA